VWLAGRAWLAFTVIAENGAAATTDDFSTDSGLWTYSGSAYRDPAGENVVLTEDITWSWGQAWFTGKAPETFVARFRYLSGGDPGESRGTGGDGIVLMFYKSADYSPTYPDHGGSLGFSAAPHASQTPVPGYGVELDAFPNGEYSDPSDNHIALIKDRPGNHLASVDDSRTEDFEWSSRSESVPVVIRHAGGTTTVRVNQRLNGGQWNLLGKFTFAGAAEVTVVSEGGGYSTCADAVRLQP
jgi:hypothetical protein